MHAPRKRHLVRLTGVAAAIALAGLAHAQELGPNGGVVSHAMVMFGAPKYDLGFDHLSYADPDAPQGGTLRQHVVGSFDSMNGYITAGTSPAGRHLMIEQLMGRVWDEPFTLYGLLAESVEMPDDRSWVVFTLRPEARWHDGTPVTSADVKWTIDTMMAEGSPRYQRYAGFIDAVTAPDERTVRIDFNADANREMPMIMGLWPVLSKAWYETHPFNEVSLDVPMGSGPYQVTELDPGRRIVYGRVDDYWGAGLGLNRGLYNFDAYQFTVVQDLSLAFEKAKKGRLYDSEEDLAFRTVDTEYRDDQRILVDANKFAEEAGLTGSEKVKFVEEFSYYAKYPSEKNEFVERVLGPDGDSRNEFRLVAEKLKDYVAPKKQEMRLFNKKTKEELGSEVVYYGKEDEAKTLLLDHVRYRNESERVASGLGIEIGGGLGPMKGKTWRIGLMGDTCRETSVLLFLAAVERCLADQGQSVPAGAGVAAANAFFGSH